MPPVLRREREKKQYVQYSAKKPRNTLMQRQQTPASIFTIVGVDACMHAAEEAGTSLHISVGVILSFLLCSRSSKAVVH